MLTLCTIIHTKTVYWKMIKAQCNANWKSVFLESGFKINYESS